MRTVASGRAGRHRRARSSAGTDCACRTPARQPARRAVIPDSRARLRDARGRRGGTGRKRDSAEAHSGIGKHRGDQGGGSGRPGIGDRLKGDDRRSASPEQARNPASRRSGHTAHIHSGPPRRSHAQPGRPGVSRAARPNARCLRGRLSLHDQRLYRYISTGRSYQIAFYVQHSGVTWGILTNGRLWRLVHKAASSPKGAPG